MKLPKNILSDTYRKPNVYLCQTNKDKIGQLDISNLKGTFKWKGYSEISFDVNREYNDIVTGETLVNPYYDLADGLRLVYVEGFGYFQLQNPSINSDGIKETKSFDAYSAEYDLSNRYLETFFINMGTDESIDGVQLYDNIDQDHSLLHLVLREKAPDWKIGYVDVNLATQRRFFEVDRESVYDFLMNEMSETFKCVVIFNTLDNTVNVYDEETAGSDTDVSITFENLANNMKVDYSTDDIKTVLTVTGADDLNIREVNYGLPNITDLTFYHTVQWMGQSLYDEYSDYLVKLQEYTQRYQDDLNAIKGYNASIYQMTNKVGENLTDAKIEQFLDFLRDYYGPKPIEEGSLEYEYNKVDIELLDKLLLEFNFLGEDVTTQFKIAMTSIDSSYSHKENAILSFLNKMWNEYGTNTLNNYENAYRGVQISQIDSKWSDEKDKDYYMYHANYMMLQSVVEKLYEVNNSIAIAKEGLNQSREDIRKIADLISIKNNISPENIIRLAPFLREDEYNDDCFVVTEKDTEEDIMETKFALLKAGQKELSKLSQPRLSFETSIANIFAIDEFQPIINQFNLGNMIRIVLRKDYIKKARLLEVEINFEDFSDISVKFGDLLSIKDQADIHADLLSQAINAGKSVAKNSSNWQKGSNAATKIEDNIKKGLLDAATSIKAIDGTQHVDISKYGIRLRTTDEDGNYRPEQVWLVNNQILFTNDNFKTTKAVIGKFKYDINGDNELDEQYGVIADALVGGVVEGSRILGGSINIGDGIFIVDENGNVNIDQWGGSIADSVDNGLNKIESIETDIVDISEYNDILKTYFNFQHDGLVIGRAIEGSDFYTKITPYDIGFYQGVNKIAYVSNNKMYNKELEVQNNIQVVSHKTIHSDSVTKPSFSIGNYRFVIEENESMSIVRSLIQVPKPSIINCVYIPNSQIQITFSPCSYLSSNLSTYGYVTSLISNYASQNYLQSIDGNTIACSVTFVDGILSLVPETFADQYILNIPAGTIINTGDGDKYEDISIGNDAIKIIISTNNN